MIKRLSTRDPDFDARLQALLRIPASDRDEVRSSVRQIVGDVRAGGDEVVVALTNKWDRRNVGAASELEITPSQMQEAIGRVDDLVLDALKLSIERVRRYHRQQRRALGDGVDWSYDDEDGNQLGQHVRAMQRVGIYVPGGKASYPSSVIMTAVPAKVAGVTEVILVVPAPDNIISDVLLAASALCGVDRLFTVGGAQAIAALAYGTQTIPRVDKIVGPGNIYVATAKELVFGDVGIDMIAGPSEVVIVADRSARVDWLVMDLFAQAEHDELAQAILISDDDGLLDRAEALINETLQEMPRADIIKASIQARGALVKVTDLADAVRVVNGMAPEHLELALEEPDRILPQITAAGAIFVGAHTAEAMGDYCAGPSHVLPTGGSARFASPLGVYDFQLRTSIIRCSPRGAVVLGRAAAIMAAQEGLDAHAQSASLRVEG